MISLEEKIVNKWTEFFDVREIRDLAKEIAIKELNESATCTITTFNISHCRIQSSGLILWLEFRTENIEATSEIFVSHDSFKHLKTISNRL